MGKYACLLGIQQKLQKDLLEYVKKTDPRVDKPLLSKYANDVCLPTVMQLTAICEYLNCTPLELYTRNDIDLLRVHRDMQSKEQSGDTSTPKQKTEYGRRRRLNKKGDIYNLTIEISRTIADKLFAPATLRKLGYLSISDLIRHLVQTLYKQVLEEETNTT